MWEKGIKQAIKTYFTLKYLKKHFCQHFKGLQYICDPPLSMNMSFFPNILKEWFFLDPLPPFGTMSRFLPFVGFEGAPKLVVWWLKDLDNQWLRLTSE